MAWYMGPLTILTVISIFGGAMLAIHICEKHPEYTFDDQKLMPMCVGCFLPALILISCCILSYSNYHDINLDSTVLARNYHRYHSDRATELKYKRHLHHETKIVKSLPYYRLSNHDFDDMKVSNYLVIRAQYRRHESMRKQDHWNMTSKVVDVNNDKMTLDNAKQVFSEDSHHRIRHLGLSKQYVRSARARVAKAKES